MVDAGAPSDDRKADVILRSSDNVDFQYYKLLLSIASPSFFGGMFSLPQPQETGGEMKDELPVIRVTENQRMLLKMCYPWARIKLPPESEELTAAYRAAKKYAMEPLEQQIRENLVSKRFLKMILGAITCYFRLEKEARLSAMATISFDARTFPYVKEPEFMTSGDLHHLEYQT